MFKKFNSGFFTFHDMTGICDSDFVDDQQDFEGVVGDLDGPQGSGIEDIQGKREQGQKEWGGFEVRACANDVIGSTPYWVILFNVSYFFY